MLYASDLFRTGGTAHVAVEESPDELPDLVAEILVPLRPATPSAELGYRSREEWLSRVRIASMC
jgi:5-methylcytosine-specific restriction enzyme subunit McrC